MNRLTKKDANGDTVILCENCPRHGSCNDSYDCLEVLSERLSAYEDTGLTPEEIKSMQEWHDFRDSRDCISADRLRALAEADRDGRCVVLPCKVGDTVYEIARGLSIYKSGLHSYVNEHVATELNVFDWARQGDFGKTVFLTRAEAEAALGKEQK